MRKSLAVGLLLGLLATVPLAKAQEEPSKFDLYGGFYYARINVNANVPGMAPSATYIGKGGGGQSEYNVNNWLGVVGDLAGFYATSAGNGAFAGAVFTYLAWAQSEFQAWEIYAVRSNSLRRRSLDRRDTAINRHRK